MTTDSGLSCDNAEGRIPPECYQNDGLAVESETGDTLYAFGGKIDTANNGKVTFLLDGVDINGNDSDNIDNLQREGDLADNWAFVGVIDTDGFTIGVSAVPLPAAAWLFGSALLGLVTVARRRQA
jgi:hypothetical protein